MWAIVNETSYAAERTWVRDKDGRHHWIVVIKATFEFTANGELTLADEQLPPLHAPEYFGEPGQSSLRYEADLVARKPGTDLIVNAHAHAPGGKPTREVQVALRVGRVSKQLLVRGPARYVFGAAGLRVSNPELFVSRPILYEHAHGGIDTNHEDPNKHSYDARNPVGSGHAIDDAHLAGRAAPSVYYPRGDPATVGPAGFGALASYWSPRLELGGTYDERWDKTKKPLLPDDYDEACLLCAPADQRPAEPMRGGEVVELINLTATGALRLQLPTIGLTCTTHIGRRRDDQDCRLVSVVIEPEEGRLILAWQASVFVRSPDADYLDQSIVQERRAS